MSCAVRGFTALVAHPSATKTRAGFAENFADRG